MWHPYKRNERNEYSTTRSFIVSRMCQLQRILVCYSWAGWHAWRYYLIRALRFGSNPHSFGTCSHSLHTHPPTPVHTHTLIRVLLICRYAAYLAPLSTWNPKTVVSLMKKMFELWKTCFNAVSNAFAVFSVCLSSRVIECKFSSP